MLSCDRRKSITTLTTPSFSEKFQDITLKLETTGISKMPFLQHSSTKEATKNGTVSFSKCPTPHMIKKSNTRLV